MKYFSTCKKIFNKISDPMHRGWLSSDMWCGQRGVYCIGTPQFHTCQNHSSVLPQVVATTKAAHQPEVITKVISDLIDADSLSENLRSHQNRNDISTKYKLVEIQ